MSSDQKFTNIASTGQVKTISGGSTNIGPSRITYIQAKGVANSNIKIYDGTSASGTLVYEANCGTEGIDVYVPGSGIRCRTGVYLDLTNTTSVTIGYTG